MGGCSSEASFIWSAAISLRWRQFKLTAVVQNFSKITDDVCIHWDSPRRGSLSSHGIEIIQIEILFPVELQEHVLKKLGEFLFGDGSISGYVYPVKHII